MKIAETGRFGELLTKTLLKYPKSGIIETTTRCNLKCIECARNVEKGPYQDMNLETFQRLDDLLQKLERVHLFGHGETFLHPDFDRMFLKAKSYNPWISITTNATLLDEKRSKFLIDNGIDDMIFSIDSASKELFEKIRRGAKFEKVLSNIKGFVEYAQKSGRKITTSFQTVAMQMNIAELPKLIELASDLGIDCVNLIALAEYETVIDESIKKFPERGKKIVSEARRLASEKNVVLAVADPALSLPQEDQTKPMEETKNSNRIKSFTRELLKNPSALAARCRLKRKMTTRNTGKFRLRECTDPFEFIFVTVTGEVRICCVSPTIMGDLNHQTLDEIWFGDKLADFRTNFLSDNPPEECLACINRPWKEFNEISDFLSIGHNDHFICQRATGWHDLERAGNKSFRWCSETGIILLKNSGKRKILIEFYYPFNGIEQRVDLTVDGEKIKTFTFDKAGFFCKKINNPKRLEGGYICLELHPEKLIRPAELEPSSDDHRKLGIAISSVMLV